MKTAETRTRDRVARQLLEQGPATAAALAAALGLSPAAIRRHLDAMVAGGQLTSREAHTYGPRGRGRPARVFALTESGRARLHHGYDDLAVAALRFLAQRGGADLVSDFASSRVATLEARYREVLGHTGPDSEKVDALAESLSDQGYAAQVVQLPGGAQLCQHHCPVQHVAAEFPQLCEAETEVFARLLGSHVQRLATIAHGDGVCTTFVPRSGVRSPRPAGAPAPELPASPRFPDSPDSPDSPEAGTRPADSSAVRKARS